MKVSSHAVYKLTFLWAFAESGLGGLLHGFKLPITGFVLGAFSVIIISLIAYFSEKPFKDIVQATLMVVVIKFTVSPHSPLPAYVAVLFQGVLGALIFQTAKHGAWSVMVFSILVLLESAIQKPLVATVLFGTELWIALDELMNRVFSFVGIAGGENFSLRFLLAYLFVYLAWALVVGRWAYQLPYQLQNIQPEKMKGMPIETMSPMMKSKSSKVVYLLLTIIVLAALALYLLQNSNPWVYLLRTTIVLFIVYLVMVPVIKWGLAKFTAKHNSFIQAYLVALPNVQTTVQKALSFSSVENTYWKKTTAFVRYLIWLNLMDDEQAA